MCDFSVNCPCCSTALLIQQDKLPEPFFSQTSGSAGVGWFFQCGRCNFRWWHAYDPGLSLTEEQKQEKEFNIQELRRIFSELELQEQPKIESEIKAGTGTELGRGPGIEPKARKETATEIGSRTGEKINVEEKIMAEAALKKTAQAIELKQSAPQEEPRNTGTIADNAKVGNAKSDTNNTADLSSSEIIDSVKKAIIDDVKTEIDEYTKKKLKDLEKKKKWFNRSGKIGSDFFPKKEVQLAALQKNDKKGGAKGGKEGDTKYSYKRVLPQEFGQRLASDETSKKKHIFPSFFYGRGKKPLNSLQRIVAKELGGAEETIKAAEFTPELDLVDFGSSATINTLGNAPTHKHDLAGSLKNNIQADLPTTSALPSLAPTLCSAEQPVPFGKPKQEPAQKFTKKPLEEVLEEPKRELKVEKEEIVGGDFPLFTQCSFEKISLNCKPYSLPLKLKIIFRSNIIAKIHKKNSHYIAIKEPGKIADVLTFPPAEHDEGEDSHSPGETSFDSPIVLPHLEIKEIKRKKKSSGDDLLAFHTSSGAQAPDTIQGVTQGAIQASAQVTLRKNKINAFAMVWGGAVLFTGLSVFLTQKYEKNGITLWEHSFYSSSATQQTTPLSLSNITYTISNNKITVIGEIVNSCDNSLPALPLVISIKKDNITKFSWQYFPTTKRILPNEHFLFREEKVIPFQLGQNLEVELSFFETGA
jgi:hypothetical protein